MNPKPAGRFELKIELLKADLIPMIRDKSESPEGLSIEGPICASINSPNGPHIPPYLRVVIAIIGDAVKGAVTEVAKERIKTWLVEFLVRCKATRTRINGKTTEIREDLERVISEEIQIGKDD